MKLSSIFVAIFLSFSLISISFAEGLADRRHDHTRHWLGHDNIIEKIHQKHGPTAAGPDRKMKHHGQDMHQPMPTYTGGRDHHRYKHLNAHQYKREVFGSN